MSDLIHRVMGEATRLTRGGRLSEATQMIQQALQGGTAGFYAGPPPPAPARRHRATSGLEAVEVLDCPVRVAEPSTPRAATRSAPAASPPEGEAADPRAGEQWLDGSFTHQGRTLAYKLYLPPAVAGSPRARPMVVMLHGCTQNAQDFADGTQMNTLARKHGVAVLYPEQTQRANAQRCWNWFKPQHQQRSRGEPAVLAALTQSVTAQHALDPARVYVAGLSAGGAMADILGHSYPELFAAVGIHSGLPSGSANDVGSALAAMRSTRGAGISRAGAPLSPPVIVFHGDADHTVHASNGAAIIEAARSEPRAGTHPGAPRVETGSSARGQRFTHTVYSDAQGASAIEYWQLHGAGHAWSGGSARGSHTDPSGVDASALMLRFFLEHALPG